MNEDENLAAPKWMKLDADEKILCEFELAHTVHKEVDSALCLLILLLYARNKSFDVGVFWVAMTAGCAFLFCLFARQSVKTAKAKKLYVTNRRFITKRGDTVGIGDVYFRYLETSGGDIIDFKTQIYFYENKRFLFYCVADEESDEYQNFIKTIYDISKNEHILGERLPYFVKRKLVNP
nr:hypothetical protein [uncultured Campylobacter sp.]